MTFADPDHIGVIGISKWRLIEVDPKNTILSLWNLSGYLTSNVKFDPVFEIYTELSSIWYIELYN